MSHSFTSDFSDAERAWINHERYQRMKNDENYSIDAKFGSSPSKITTCTNCHEQFIGSPFSVRYSGPYIATFCGTTCCTEWMKSHGR